MRLGKLGGPPWLQRHWALGAVAEVVVRSALGTQAYRARWVPVTEGFEIVRLGGELRLSSFPTF